jgi:hypothetical protein
MVSRWKSESDPTSRLLITGALDHPDLAAIPAHLQQQHTYVHDDFKAMIKPRPNDPPAYASCTFRRGANRPDK